VDDRSTVLGGAIFGVRRGNTFVRFDASVDADGFGCFGCDADECVVGLVGFDG
jgi:hypothetical protein